MPTSPEDNESPDLTRRERRKREVRDRILEAAVVLFERQGPQETRVDEICERADVAQKTFFNHFTTKQQLVSEIATRFLNDLFATLDELRQSRSSVADRLHVFFATLADRCDAAGPMHRELVLEVIRVAHLQHHESTQMSFVRDAFRSFLEEDGRGNRSSDHDIDTLTEIVVGTFYALMLNWVSLDDYPLRERSAAAGRFLAEATSRSR